MKFDSAFQSWCFKSAVVDPTGQPLLVYRGEHGEPRDGVRFRTRLGSVSFGSRRAAEIYSRHPNRYADTAVVPRVISCFLDIVRPVVNRPLDPFIEFGEIESAIGTEASRHMASRLALHIENTNNWIDDIGESYDSVSEFLGARDDALARLYVDAYCVFDDIEFVRLFQAQGYDGAIHGGSGVTSGEAEYKIFCSSQAYFVETLVSHSEVYQGLSP